MDDHRLSMNIGQWLAWQPRRGHAGGDDNDGTMRRLTSYWHPFWVLYSGLQVKLCCVNTPISRFFSSLFLRYRQTRGFTLFSRDHYLLPD
jgi:hypothetical protein